MSKILYDDGGLLVSTYTGRERLDGGDRKRIQITDVATYERGGDCGCRQGHVALSIEQWRHLLIAAEQLGADCDGPEIDA